MKSSTSENLLNFFSQLLKDFKVSVYDSNFTSKRTNEILKTCPKCGRSWNTIDELLADSTVVFKGIQEHFENPEKKYLLYSHRREGCETSFTVKAHYLEAKILKDLLRNKIH